MSSIENNSDPLENLTKEQISDLGKSIDVLDQEEASLAKEELEELARRESAKAPFRRLKRSPLEIINRSFFFIFLGSFVFSIISIYTVNRLWFFLYLASIFSCILYTPNRKAIKELLDAWPNVEELIKDLVNKTHS